MYGIDFATGAAFGAVSKGIGSVVSIGLVLNQYFYDNQLQQMREEVAKLGDGPVHITFTFVQKYIPNPAPLM